jgi:peroxiredoxin
MALTYTPSAEIGSFCPPFHLRGVDNKTYDFEDFQDSNALVVMFICNHCPYVQAVEDRLLSLARQTIPLGAEFVAICSNDAEKYPDDSFENLKKRWLDKRYPFPYLFDEDQQVAKAFGAVCTPDFFVYNEKLKLAYRGRLDDSWKDPAAVKSEDLKDAILSCLEKRKVPGEQKPSMGCSIKWKS